MKIVVIGGSGLIGSKLVAKLREGGHDPLAARATADRLLPDILPYDHSNAAGYPNGRRLADDIIDIQLALATNGRVTGDTVGPHTDLLPSFPYLGAPHPVATPASAGQPHATTA